MPSRRSLDPEPYARRDSPVTGEQETEQERRKAARVLLRILMRREGCTGPGCQEGHQAHLKAGRLLAMAVEAMPDPDSIGHHTAPGYVEPPERIRARKAAS